MSNAFTPSRYLSYSSAEGGALVLYNSLTGAIGAVPPEQAQFVRESLRRTARHSAPLDGVLADLHEGGFLISEGVDERAVSNAQFLQRYTDNRLHLIILPTEQCNFRCVYCYESFLRGKMPESIRTGIKRYVAAQTDMQELTISWFGGEALLASDVVLELSEYFHEFMLTHGIRYSADATTNGYFLTPDLAEKLIPLGVNSFQITLDGIQDEHDKRRVLQHGGGTFATIMQNLRYLRDSDLKFEVMIRHNFDPGNAERLQEFIAVLRREFGEDPRFSVFFYPVGKLGGSNDPDLAVCEGKSLNAAAILGKHLATEAGLRNALQIEHMQPRGSVCYAANPRSFVVGSNGNLYKCTVELDYHDRNIVGHLFEDGRMELDWRKMALWCETHGMEPEESKQCYNCFFAPACQGASCPKDWMDSNEPPCPTEKVTVRKLLPILHQQAQNPAVATLSAATMCTK